MERPSRVAGIKQHSLTVSQLPRQALCQVFVGNRGRRDDNEICAVYHRWQIRADEEWHRKFLCAILHELDPAALGNRQQRALGTGKKPDFIPAKREVRRGRATATAGAENCDFRYRHGS